MLSSEPGTAPETTPPLPDRLSVLISALRDRLGRACAPVAVPFDALPGNARGAVWVLIAGVFFTVMTALIKAIGNTISVAQILLICQITMTCTVLPMLVSGFPSAFRTSHLALHLAGVGLTVAAMICGFVAVVHLPLAEATALGFAKSLFVTVFALLLLHEVPGPRRWISALLGFVGVLVMVQPGGGGLDIYAALAVLGAAAAAAVTVIIRKVAQIDRPVTILGYQAILVSVLMVPPALYYWVVPTLREWLIMGAIGLLSVIGQLANIRGFKAGEASAIAPMDYSRLVFATAIGFVVFLEVPDLPTMIGAALIVATSLYAIQAERRAAPPPDPRPRPGS